MSSPKNVISAGKKSRLSQLGWIERADIAIVLRCRGIIESRVGRALGTAGRLADEPPLLTLAAATAAAGGLRSDGRLLRAGICMAIAEFIAIGFKNTGKRLVSRSRPAQLLDKNTYSMAAGGSDDHSLKSFPSGHTAGAIATAYALGHAYPRVAAPAFVVAALLGMLQVPRRAHFPSDVCAGAALGVVAGWLATRLLPQGTHASGRR